jgi:hypothetical protein
LIRDQTFEMGFHTAWMGRIEFTDMEYGGRFGHDGTSSSVITP